MIKHTPHPVLFSIGDFNVFSWGFIVALGALIVYFLLIREFKKRNLNSKHLENMFMLALLGGLFGARLFFVVMDLPYFIKNPLKIFAVWEGGMVSYGGLIVASLLIFFYMRKNKLSFIEYSDIILPYVALGYGIGRIGCFVNWDDYGIATNLPWGVIVPGAEQAVHPTQIYLMLMDLSIFVILKFFIKKPKFKGQITYLFMIMLGGIRFFIEFLRDYLDMPQVKIYTQTILALMFFSGVILYVINSKKLNKINKKLKSKNHTKK